MKRRPPAKRTQGGEGEVVWQALELSDGKEIKIERKDFTVDDAVKHKEHFLLYGVLTPGECTSLIDQTEALGYTTLDGVYRTGYRSNWRVIVHDDDAANTIFQRVKPLIPQQLIAHDSIWEPIGLNGRWRFCRYTPGQHFDVHVDAGFVPTQKPGAPREGSFLTFMLYLNPTTEADGGATNFVTSRNRDRVINASIQPSTGMAMIFDHNMLHEGAVLKQGKKWIMRSEVMYREVGKAPRKPVVHKAVPVAQLTAPVTGPPTVAPTPATATSSLSTTTPREDDVVPTTAATAAGPVTADGAPSLF